MSDNSLIFSRTQENVFAFLLDTTSGEALGAVSGHAAIFLLTILNTKERRDMDGIGENRGGNCGSSYFQALFS